MLLACLVLVARVDDTSAPAAPVPIFIPHIYGFVHVHALILSGILLFQQVLGINACLVLLEFENRNINDGNWWWHKSWSEDSQNLPLLKKHKKLLKCLQGRIFC